MLSVLGWIYTALLCIAAFKYRQRHPKSPPNSTLWNLRFCPNWVKPYLVVCFTLIWSLGFLVAHVLRLVRGIHYALVRRVYAVVAQRGLRRTRLSGSRTSKPLTTPRDPPKPPARTPHPPDGFEARPTSPPESPKYVSRLHSSLPAAHQLLGTPSLNEENLRWSMANLRMASGRLARETLKLDERVQEVVFRANTLGQRIDRFARVVDGFREKRLG